MVWIKFSATWKKLKKISFFHQQHQHQPTTNQATTKHKQKTTALTKQIKTENMASLSTSDIDDDDDAFTMLASQFGGESATATRAGDSTAAAFSTEIPECLMGVDERTRDSLFEHVAGVLYAYSGYFPPDDLLYINNIAGNNTIGAVVDWVKSSLRWTGT